MAISVLTVSSKGQIVLPAEIRNAMSINSGDKLAVYAVDDVIMLKAINIPSEEDFKLKLNEAQAWAKEVGLAESEINDIVKSVRKKRKK